MNPASPVIPEREDLAHFEHRIGEGQEGVQPLPSLSFNDGEFHVSRWEPTDEELAEIIRTRSVYIYTFGRCPAPVYAAGHAPLVAEKDETQGEGRVM